jgi:hypothetical protein
MVNEKELRKVLPKIFTVGDPRYKNLHSEYVTKKRKLERIARRHPSKLSGIVKKAARALDEIGKALNEDIEW